MERHGFIHDMLDVKVLILFVMARVLYPVNEQKIYELCYQDDCLSYFDVRQAIPQMVESGHLEQTEEGFVITENGREAGAVTEDSIAYPVMQRTLAAVERFNREIRRDSFIRTEIIPQKNGDFSVVMGLDDEVGNLMTLELMAPSQKQARCLTRAFHKHADLLFQNIMSQLLEDSAEDAGDGGEPAGG